MSIDDGKPIYDAANGKRLYDPATGELLYGAVTDVFTYAQMDVLDLRPFAGFVPHTVIFKLIEGTGGPATIWAEVEADPSEPIQSVQWFDTAVAANTRHPYPFLEPNPVIDGYRWNVRMELGTGLFFQGSTVFLLPTSGAPPPHDYPDGVYSFSIHLFALGGGFDFDADLTLTLSSSPIPPFT